MDTEAYRSNIRELSRTADLLRLVPRGRRSVLDIGAWDGHFSRLLLQQFEEVTALDLEKPTFESDGVTTVAGDVMHLGFPNASFDCVFCTEVLEHVTDLSRACKEIMRVARHEIVIGVPWMQDTRVGRTTCTNCGNISPPWGHINTFDEVRLHTLFSSVRVIATSFVGSSTERTNFLSSLLMDFAGNPWGAYGDGQFCLSCRGALVRAPERNLLQRSASALAQLSNKLQALTVQPRPYWVHMVFSKDSEPPS